jgi:hypothetical protein
MILNNADIGIIIFTELRVIYFIILNLYKRNATGHVPDSESPELELGPIVTQLAQETLCGLFQVLDVLWSDFVRVLLRPCFFVKV